jgi:hypothetical protein
MTAEVLLMLWIVLQLTMLPVLGISDQPHLLPPYTIDSASLLNTVEAFAEGKYMTEEQQGWWVAFLRQSQSASLRQCETCRTIRQKEQSVNIPKIPRNRKETPEEHRARNDANNERNGYKRELKAHLNTSLLHPRPRTLWPGPSPRFAVAAAAVVSAPSPASGVAAAAVGASSDLPSDPNPSEPNTDSVMVSCEEVSYCPSGLYGVSHRLLPHCSYVHLPYSAHHQHDSGR